MEHGTDIYELIGALRARGEEFCLATVVRTHDVTSAKAGAKAVVTRDGTIKGFLGGGCVQGAVKQAAAEALAEGAPRLIRVKPKDQVVAQADLDGVQLHKSSCPSGGTADIFIEPMLNAPHLVVCGASPVAVAVADLGARMGYRVSVAALAEDLPQFSGAASTQAGFDMASLGVNQGAFIVVATQGKRDREALAAALLSGAHYVGFVGSRRKAAALTAELRRRGLTDDAFAKLSAPAGLHIQAIEPAEIALSILGEIVALRRRGAREPGAGDRAGAAAAGGGGTARPG